MRNLCRLDILVLVAVGLTACAESPQLTTTLSQGQVEASPPENLAHFRLCRGVTGFGGRIAYLLDIYGNRGVLYSGLSNGVPIEKVTKANMARCPVVEDVYTPTWITGQRTHSGSI
jgi:hypothetical protein